MTQLAGAGTTRPDLFDPALYPRDFTAIAGGFEVRSRISCWRCPTCPSDNRTGPGEPAPFHPSVRPGRMLRNGSPDLLPRHRQLRRPADFQTLTDEASLRFQPPQDTLLRV